MRGEGENAKHIQHVCNRPPSEVAHCNSISIIGIYRVESLHWLCPPHKGSSRSWEWGYKGQKEELSCFNFYMKTGEKYRGHFRTRCCFPLEEISFLQKMSRYYSNTKSERFIRSKSISQIIGQELCLLGQDSCLPWAGAQERWDNCNSSLHDLDISLWLQISHAPFAVGNKWHRGRS